MNKKVRIALKGLCGISLIIIVITSIYGILEAFLLNADVVGETFVTFEFPPISVFPLFYSKPITWLSASLLSFYLTLLELNVEKISKLTGSLRNSLRLVALFVGAMAFYEVMFNFTLWSGLIAREGILGVLNVDIIKNPFPNPKTPWNIGFAPKLFTVLFVLALYSVYYLQRIESKIGKENWNQHSNPTDIHT